MVGGCSLQVYLKGASKYEVILWTRLIIFIVVTVFKHPLFVRRSWAVILRPRFMVL
jgi:hypothetical protein